MAFAKRRGEAGHAAYGEDFYTWAFEQAALLRAGRLGEVDAENLAEEIETLGRSEFSGLASTYRVILVNMLKWDHQPERRTRSWTVSIDTQRVTVEDDLRDNPGLRPRMGEAIERAYRRARIEAAGQMRRSKASLPEVCPYTQAEIRERPFEWPEA